MYREPASSLAVALSDRCPHRAAPLSLGRLTSGVLECRYHGWRFDTEGVCVHAPSKPSKPPAAAKIRSYPVREADGWCWVWPGDVDKVDQAPGPEVHLAWGRPKEVVPWTGYVDLDIDHSLLVENFLDPAHLPFTHDTTLSKSENATTMTIADLAFSKWSVKGRQVTPERPDLPAVEFEFKVPCLVALKFRRRGSPPLGADQAAGVSTAPFAPFDQTFYAVPTRQGHCRFIYFQRIPVLPSPTSPLFSWAPPLRSFLYWYLHRFNHRVLTEDYELLKGVQRNLAHGASAFDSSTAVSADAVVGLYREWWRKSLGGKVGKKVWFQKFEGARDIEDIALDGNGCPGGSC
ncbi:hypothetical protein HKX48_004419 [Thoreauomyces humboldtii]|nr:hypothetical protein HKX48_004419 [Thoreauomyces humboldtii]